MHTEPTTSSLASDSIASPVSNRERTRAHSRGMLAARIGVAGALAATALAGGALAAGPSSAQTLPDAGIIQSGSAAIADGFGDPGSLSPRYLFGPGPGEIRCMAITPGCMGLIPYLMTQVGGGSTGFGMG